MQTSDIKHGQAAYDAAQRDLLEGDWSLEGVAPGQAEADAVWDRMSQPDADGEIPIDSIRKRNLKKITAVTDPIAYRVIWDREAAALEAEFGIIHDMPEAELAKILKQDQGKVKVINRSLGQKQSQISKESVASGKALDRVRKVNASDAAMESAETVVREDIALKLEKFDADQRREARITKGEATEALRKLVLAANTAGKVSINVGLEPLKEAADTAENRATIAKTTAEGLAAATEATAEGLRGKVKRVPPYDKADIIVQIKEAEAIAKLADTAQKQAIKVLKMTTEAKTAAYAVETAMPAEVPKKIAATSRLAGAAFNVSKKEIPTSPSETGMAAVMVAVTRMNSKAKITQTAVEALAKSTATSATAARTAAITAIRKGANPDVIAAAEAKAIEAEAFAEITKNQVKTLVKDAATKAQAAKEASAAAMTAFNASSDAEAEVVAAEVLITSTTADAAKARTDATDKRAAVVTATTPDVIAAAEAKAVAAEALAKTLEERVQTLASDAAKKEAEAKKAFDDLQAKTWSAVQASSQAAGAAQLADGAIQKMANEVIEPGLAVRNSSTALVAAKSSVEQMDKVTQAATTVRPSQAVIRNLVTTSTNAQKKTRQAGDATEILVNRMDIRAYAANEAVNRLTQSGASPAVIIMAKAKAKLAEDITAKANDIWQQTEKAASQASRAKSEAEEALRMFNRDPNDSGIATRLTAAAQAANASKTEVEGVESKMKQFSLSPTRQADPIIPKSRVSERDKKNYTLYQWVLRHRVKRFFRVNMQGREFDHADPNKVLTNEGKEVFRETLVRTAPHLTIFHPQENLNWVNDASRADLRDTLRDLMGEDLIPKDKSGSGKIEATPDMIAVLAYLRRPTTRPVPGKPPLAPDEQPLARLKELHTEAVGGDVTKAEERLTEVGKFYEPIKNFRDAEKRKFDRKKAEKSRLMAERETTLNRYQPAADAIIKIIEAEEERFTKKGEVDELDGRAKKQEQAVGTLRGQISSTPPPAPTPSAAPNATPDPREDLLQRQERELQDLETGRELARTVRAEEVRKLKNRIGYTRRKIQKQEADPSDNNPKLLQERKDRFQRFENELQQAEQDEQAEIRRFEADKLALEKSIQALKDDISNKPPAPAAPNLMPMAPMADPRETRLQAMEAQLQTLQSEHQQAQTKLGQLTAKSRRLRAGYTTAFNRQINHADATIKGLFSVVNSGPLALSAVADQAAWDAAMKSLTDAPAALMADHTTRFATWETDKRALDQTQIDDQRKFDERFDPTLAFEKYKTTELPTGTTKTDLKDAHYLNFQQLETEYTEAVRGVSQAKATRQAHAGRPTNNLTPIETLRQLHMTDPEYMKKFGDPEERKFRSMVSALLMVNTARNRAVYARRIRRLAENASTPSGVVQWVREQKDIVMGKAPRSFDEYRIDHLLTNPKFRQLEKLRLNTPLSEIASWVGEGDTAVLSLESLRELIDDHVRPLAMDAKSGARLRLKDSAKIVYLLERLEAVYCTALVRKKLSAPNAPTDKAALFASMLGEQLTGDVSGNPGHFMTISEAQADRGVRQPLIEGPTDGDADGDGTAVATTGWRSWLSADRLFSLGSSFVTNWLLHRRSRRGRGSNN